MNNQRKTLIASAAIILMMLTGCSSASNSDNAKIIPQKKVHSQAQGAFDNVLGESALLGIMGLKTAGYKNIIIYLADGTEVTEGFNHYTIIKQQPTGSKRHPENTVITLTVKPMMESILNEVGKEYSAAKSDLATVGLKATSAQDTGIDEQSSWKVASQSPAAGVSLPYGSPVSLVLTQPKIVYKVTGNGSESNIITYSPPGQSSPEQASNAHLPWSMSWPDNNLGGFEYVSAQDENGTSISCAIIEDGEVLQSQTSTGQYAIVTCSLDG